MGPADGNLPSLPSRFRFSLDITLSIERMECVSIYFKPRLSEGGARSTKISVLKTDIRSSKRSVIFLLPHLYGIDKYLCEGNECEMIALYDASDIIIASRLPWRLFFTAE